MMTVEKDKDELAAARAAANIKLAVFLGFVALSFYAGFIWYYFK
jgi:hypothetical protein